MRIVTFDLSLNLFDFAMLKLNKRLKSIFILELHLKGTNTIEYKVHWESNDERGNTEYTWCCIRVCQK